MKKIAIYPGTFDPITNGHLDLIKRALRTFDEVIIAIAPSLKRQPLFTIQERLNLIHEAVSGMERTRVDTFHSLLVDYAKKQRGSAILRGLRAMSDFEYELQLAHMNRRLNKDIETVFMMPSQEYSYLTSSIIKEISSFGGSVRGLVPKAVEKALREKYRGMKYPKG